MNFQQDFTQRQSDPIIYPILFLTSFLLSYTLMVQGVDFKYQIIAVALPIIFMCVVIIVGLLWGYLKELKEKKNGK